MFNWFKKEKRVELPKPKVGDTRIRSVLYADGREEWFAEVYVSHGFGVCDDGSLVSNYNNWYTISNSGHVFLGMAGYPNNEKECEEAILKYKENKLAEKLRTTVVQQRVRKFP